MTATIAPVAIRARPGGEPVRYAVEVAPTGLVARYRSVVDPQDSFTVVEADCHRGELFNVKWHGQWAIVGPPRLRARLLAAMRDLAAGRAPDH